MIWPSFMRNTHHPNPQLWLAKIAYFRCARLQMPNACVKLLIWKKETFLIDTTWRDDWKLWFAAALPEENIIKSGPEYSLYSLALEECKNGAGVLMGHEHLVRSHLDAGSLVKPIEQSVLLDRVLSIQSAKPIAPISLLERVVNRLLG